MTETSPLATVSYPRAELRDAGEDEAFRRAAMAGSPVPLASVSVRRRCNDRKNNRDAWSCCFCFAWRSG
jgi:fatty-acyl-CoA synthase